MSDAIHLDIVPTAKIIEAIRLAVEPVLDETADELMFRIEESTYREKHGRVYPSKREHGVTHTASAPGEPFASDTASLISTMKLTGRIILRRIISFEDARWAVLEFGNGKVAARPTITPAGESLRDEFQQNIARAAMDALIPLSLK